MNANLTKGTQKPVKAAPPMAREDLDAIKLYLESYLESYLEGVIESKFATMAAEKPKFTAADRDFLIWVIAFAAGSHFEKGGEQGERIFAWCRRLSEQMGAQAFADGGNGS